MPNHVHFIMVPTQPDGLRATFAEAHRRYTSLINARFGWTGHLWQGRFNSSVMDERHLMAALRYVALNPVRAGLGPRRGLAVVGGAGSGAGEAGAQASGVSGGGVG